MDYSLCEAAIIGNTQSLKEIMQTDPLILDKFLAGFFHCENPLHVATSNGQTHFVKELLGFKPKLAKALDSQQRSALHLASDEGQHEIVEELIRISPEMCLVRDRDGHNPLHLAAIKGNLIVLEVLLQANPQAAQVRVDLNETILHLCVKHNQLKSLELLLNTIWSGALVNAKDNDGNTILHIAILEKRYEIVKHVIRNVKIDMNERSGSGHTAMDILFLVDAGAEQGELDQIKDLLRRANALRARDIAAAEWITKIKDTLMVVASLMATMAFQAGVSPPGGVWQDDSNGHRAGESVMASHYADSYLLFRFLNTTGFVASLTVILLLLIKRFLSPSKFAAKKVYILFLTISVAIMSVAMSYAYSNVMVSSEKEMKSLDRNGLVIGMLLWCGCVITALISDPLGYLLTQEGPLSSWNLFLKMIGINVGGESPPLPLTSS